MDIPFWVFIVTIIALALVISINIFLIYFIIRFLVSVPTSLQRIANSLEEISGADKE